MIASASGHSLSASSCYPKASQPHTSPVLAQTVAQITSTQSSTGHQRDWLWRGWQTRYTFLPAKTNTAAAPMLFLHGFGASLGHWRQNLPFFAQERPVYALDLLGFGGSEKAAIDYRIHIWADQVYHFWQTFIRRPVVLVGNSIGSLVALTVAAQYPQIVDHLVMLSLPDPAVREELIPQCVRPLVAAVERLFTADILLKPLFYWVRQPRVVRPWAGLAYANAAAVTDELLEILSGPAYDRGSAQAFVQLLRGMTHRHFGPRVAQILPTLSIPILLIWGRQDRMVPPAFAETFAQMNPLLKLVMLDPAGHCPHDECPEIVNRTIQDWLASSGTT